MNPRMTPEQADALLATMTDADFSTSPEDQWMSDQEVASFVEAGRRAAGRPSLTRAGEHSPRLATRVPQPLKDKLTRAAAIQHRRESDIVRDALTDYLARVES